MTSEAEIKDVVLNALREIHLRLGLPNDGTIHSTLLEFYGDANRAQYLYCNTPEGHLVRAWAVDTADRALDLETFNTTALSVRIILEAYYDIEHTGLGRERLRNHLDIVLEALIALCRDLSNTVSLIRSWSIGEPRVISESAAKTGQILILRLEMDVEQANATFV